VPIPPFLSPTGIVSFLGRAVWTQWCLQERGILICQLFCLFFPSHNPVFVSSRGKMFASPYLIIVPPFCLRFQTQSSAASLRAGFMACHPNHVMYLPLLPPVALRGKISPSSSAPILSILLVIFHMASVRSTSFPQFCLLAFRRH